MTPDRRDEIREIARQVRWDRMKPWERAVSIALALSVVPYVMARNTLRAIRRKSPENPKS